MGNIPYSGIFSREKFFANRQYVWPNGNFSGKTKPRLPNTCYAIFDHLSLFRGRRRHECELYFGIHDSFQFEPSLRQCSEVVAPAFLSRLSYLRSIGHVPITKKFTENIFADSRKAAKFVKIFSLEKIPLYNSPLDEV